MAEMGIWIFASVCVFCILVWNLSKLRLEYEQRERRETMNILSDDETMAKLAEAEDDLAAGRVKKIDE